VTPSNLVARVKGETRTVKRRLGALVLCSVLVVFPLWAAGCGANVGEVSRRKALAEAARARVSVGMPLSAAEQELRAAEGFSVKLDCGYSVSVHTSLQYFLYGSPDYHEAGIVWVMGNGPGHQHVVAGLGEVELEMRRELARCAPTE
jgi:hypothetical protein